MIESEPPAPGLRRWRWPARVAGLRDRLRPLRGAIVAAASVGAVISGLAGYWNAYHALRAQTAMSAPGPANGDVLPMSLAVLPFGTAQSDADWAATVSGLGDALASGIQDVLSTFLPQTRIVPLHDAASAAGASPQQVAREHQVAFVLAGRVSKTGSIIRLDLQLIDGASGAQVGSETVEGNLADPLALIERARGQAPNIADKMFTSAARAIAAKRAAPSADELLVQGAALFWANGSELEGMKKVEVLYRRALAQDPRNVKAMESLAGALAWQVELSERSTRPPSDAELERRIDEAEALIRQAGPLDGSATLMTLNIAAEVARFREDYAGLLAAQTAIVDRFPQFDGSHVNLGDAYLLGGDPAKAIEQLDQGLAIEGHAPSSIPLQDLGYARMMQGDSAQAIAALQRARALNPGSAEIAVLLALSEASAGDAKAAAAAVADLHRIEPDYAFANFERAYRPMASAPPAYRAWWNGKLLPLWRLAALPR